ncbi:MAG: ATP-binding protein [Sediminibacterium sp.]|jgi:NtrC-family two-component system sensor histidine kinase KinB|nr:HAMP domain-containing protein [Chitinophagaceae bacterium]
MTIKVKLNLGIGLLFILITLLTVISNFYINKLSGDTKEILVANYNTLDYSREMLISLNEGSISDADMKHFQDNLNKQQHNVTEIGEQELTDKLTADFAQLKRNRNDSTIIKKIRTDITDIIWVNMQAIQRKNAIAQSTVDDASIWIIITGTFCFLIALTLLFNLPSNIANPIQELTHSFKEVAAQNYSQRVHFHKHNEFGELASTFNTMAEKLGEYKNSNLEKLTIEKKRIDTLINNLKDPVIGLDENRRILFMNDVAIKVAGLKSKDEVIGQLVQDIAVKNDLVRSLIQDLFTSEATQTDNKMLIKIYADNRESYFEKEIIPIKITPTGEKEEKLIGNVILLQNITPYKELDFAKTNFIATVSHELKTPISSIQMSLQLLENKRVGVINSEQKKLIESIKEDTGRLLKITSELLNMTQVESGNIELSIAPVNPIDILDFAVHTTKMLAEQKQIKFNINCDDNLPQILVDKEKTSWVLINLISNAIRYSYDNSIIFLNITKDKNVVKISVKDTGQGISSQYISKIFNRYFRVPGTKKEGTGLGLAISKEFIEAQDGQISVESELGAGTTFTLTLKTFA